MHPQGAVFFLIVLGSLASSIAIRIRNNLELQQLKSVPCFFIFGDSLVDSGNNNDLQSTGKVKYLPYGIDFPEGPTGRYTNGRTAADYLGEKMGFKDFIKPYTRVNTSELLEGANYASGYAGIQDETGQHVGARVTLTKQLQNFGSTVSRLGDLLGSKASAVEHVGECLFLLVVGSNDYINNYYLPQLYKTSSRYTPKEYATHLLSHYTKTIENLYKQGARKFAIAAVPPIGCTPNATATYQTKGAICVGEMNEAAELFNHELESLILEMGRSLSGSKLVFLNVYKLMFDIVASLAGWGKEIVEWLVDACCELKSNALCKESKNACPNRQNMLFWDGTHPSDAWNKVVADYMFLTVQTVLI